MNYFIKVCAALVLILCVSCSKERPHSFLSVTSKLKTKIPGINKFYLEGHRNISFEYEKRFLDGDHEKGAFIFKVNGAFSNRNTEAAYSLTGSSEFLNTIEYKKPSNIVALPEHILLSVYNQSEINSVITRIPLSEKEKKEMGVISGDIFHVHYDIEKAKNIFNKPIHFTSSTTKEKINSQLFGKAHLHIDEAGLVWIKLFMTYFGLAVNGIVETTNIKKIDENNFEVELKWNGDFVRFKLKRNLGLSYLEHCDRLGTVTTIKISEVSTLESDTLK